ncbi:hypothetical protein EDD86DRAFT_244250 [Gorgonomyces haynaldii]|nr:hypothetical protein EDD86DRAFT_244250 [Gorgonomyces haynaldii]
MSTRGKNRLLGRRGRLEDASSEEEVVIDLDSSSESESDFEEQEPVIVEQVPKATNIEKQNSQNFRNDRKKPEKIPEQPKIINIGEFKVSLGKRQSKPVLEEDVAETMAELSITEKTRPASRSSKQSNEDLHMLPSASMSSNQTNDSQAPEAPRSRPLLSDRAKQQLLASIERKQKPQVAVQDKTIKIPQPTQPITTKKVVDAPEFVPTGINSQLIYTQPNDVEISRTTSGERFKENPSNMIPLQHMLTPQGTVLYNPATGVMIPADYMYAPGNYYPQYDQNGVPPSYGQAPYNFYPQYAYSGTQKPPRQGAKKKKSNHEQDRGRHRASAK